ncbi:MAG: xanthine dehydrogenase family protein molybdopterin-binding subunit, partial [Candidatus Eremiobacteraeota bacterium]|nr:xanthine dehydrogenase family protein molybdopterin-binding subunit [Candidatus Eremiobacteraeota bacterium]
LTREQMFTSVGHRSATRQRLRIGASRDGRLRALLHDVEVASSRVGTFVESAGRTTSYLFHCDHHAITHALARLDAPTPTAMRAPGEAPGTFALGCAMDELAAACGLDPLDVLRRNHADVHNDGLPYSSKHLRACYDRGAERFGWADRARAPRARRDGDELVGWGVATASYPGIRVGSHARVALRADGGIEVSAASHDLGTGTYTILTQIAADALGVAAHAVRVRIGDTALPRAPLSGGSATAASVGPAVQAAAREVRTAALDLAVRDARSPLFGREPAAIDVVDGVLRADGAGELTYAEAVRLSGGDALERTASAEPGDEEDRYAFHSFGAQFVEVRVDEELGRVRVTRCLGAFDAGRILNPKTARSQMIGGIVWGISMALCEETVRDERSGALINANLSDYHVAVNADVGEIDVLFVEEPDLVFNPLGARGIGEIGITGVAAAIANAVYHATGVRVRELPITPDRFLAAAG